MFRFITVCFLAFSGLLGACQVEKAETLSVPTVRTSAIPTLLVSVAIHTPMPTVTPDITSTVTPTSTATPIFFAPTITHAELAASTEPPGTLTLLPTGPPPDIFYIDDNKLMKISFEEGLSHLHIANLPDEGEIEDVIQVGEVIYVLREKGLQIVSLLDSTIDLLIPFKSPIIFGQLIATSDGARVVFSVYEENPRVTSNGKQSIHVYCPHEKRAREVLSIQTPFGGFLKPLGFTANGEGLYIAPLGMDADIVDIWLLGLQKGDVTEFQGYFGRAIVVLSSDTHYLATMSPRVDPSNDRHLEYGIGLYDLSTESITDRWIAPLNLPSYAQWLFWSRDSRVLYFHLLGGQPGDTPELSYGLWRFDLASETLSQVAAIDPTASFITLSPNGEWILLKSWRNDEWLVGVHLPTGTTVSIVLPADNVTIVR